jgi:hypothetical protein
MDRLHVMANDHPIRGCVMRGAVRKSRLQRISLKARCKDRPPIRMAEAARD